VAVQPIASSVQQDYRADLVVPSAPSFLSETLPEMTPVRIIGGGIPRPNARQAVKTYSVVKTSAGGETFYEQIATVTATTRIFFLGVSHTQGASDVYVEDASTGNIAISDGGSVALTGSPFDGTEPFMIPFPRECKRGIRLAMTLGAGASDNVVVYYVEERIDGQQVSL